jgi:EmrB/QacA subfamily drug resistance transporter
MMLTSLIITVTVTIMITDTNRPQAVTARPRWLVLGTVLLAQLMLVLDATVVNVALPVIQQDLHLPEARLTWISNSYLIGFGGLLLLFGRLGDLVGRRRIFLAGLTVFTLASAACGLAGSEGQLIAARFIQGGGAAAASSVVLAIIATEFPEPAERAKAMSGYMFVSVSGGSIGLLLGGVLTQAIDWHWIFLINVPVGIVAVPLARTVLRETAAPGLGEGLDVLGALLITGAAMTGIYAVVEAAVHSVTSLDVLAPAVAAVTALSLFLLLEARLSNPLMPLRILRIRSLMATSLVRLFMVMGLFGVFFFGVLELSAILHFGPVRIGLAFLPMTLVVAALSLGATARLLARFGPLPVLLTGLALVALSLESFASFGTSTSYWPQMFLTYALLGLGAGLTFLPLLTLAMSDVPAADAGLGSAIVSLSLQLSAAVDVAFLGTVASHRTEDLARTEAPLAALVGGYQRALGVAAGAVLVGLALAAVLLRPRGDAPVAVAVAESGD